MIDIGSLLIVIINGVYYSSIVYLVAVGFSLIFGIRDLVNIAHPMFLAFGGFLAVSLMSVAIQFTDSVALAFLGLLVVVPVLIAILGVVLDRLVFRYVEEIAHNYQLLATFGLALMLVDITKMIWGVSPLSLSPNPLNAFGLMYIGGGQYPWYNVFVIGVAAIAIVLPFLIFKQTKMGKIARALSEDEEMTAVLGLGTERVRTVVFAMGTGLAAAAGILLVPTTSAYPSMAIEYVLMAFAVLVIGGVGNLRGAIVASLLIGVIRSFGIAYFPEFELVIVFLLMAVVLIIKPKGIYGSEGVLE